MLRLFLGVTRDESLGRLSAGVSTAKRRPAEVEGGAAAEDDHPAPGRRGESRATRSQWNVIRTSVAQLAPTTIVVLFDSSLMVSSNSWFSFRVVLVVAADPHLPRIALVTAFRHPVKDRVVAHQEFQPSPGS